MGAGYIAGCGVLRAAMKECRGRRLLQRREHFGWFFKSGCPRSSGTTCPKCLRSPGYAQNKPSLIYDLAVLHLRHTRELLALNDAVPPTL